MGEPGTMMWRVGEQISRLSGRLSEAGTAFTVDDFVRWDHYPYLALPGRDGVEFVEVEALLPRAVRTVRIRRAVGQTVARARPRGSFVHVAVPASFVPGRPRPEPGQMFTPSADTDDPIGDFLFLRSIAGTKDGHKR